MRVEDVMSSPVVVVKNDVKVQYLKDLFGRKKINAVPVLEDDGTISGIVSSSDVARCHDDCLLVKDIKSGHVHIALKSNRVKDAAAMMVKNNVHHLVVMEEGNVVGMISSMDIVKIFAQD